MAVSVLFVVACLTAFYSCWAAAAATTCNSLLQTNTTVRKETFSNSQEVRNNELKNLEPAEGAWRGMCLGSNVFGKVDNDAKLDVYNRHYPETPLHIYRIFDQEVGPRVRAWVKQGGILWYNIKIGKKMSWQEYARGDKDWRINAWAKEVRSLEPAKVFVVLYHEPDHSVCFKECRRGGVPGNTPENYRKMWQRTRRLFNEANVANAVWAMDYSVKIGNTPTDEPCVDDACDPPETVAALWPGDDHVDWVFFNIFMIGKANEQVKADFDTMVTNSMKLLNSITTESRHCQCAPGKDSGCKGCNLFDKPWGIGAFGAKSFLLDEPEPKDKPVVPREHEKFLEDAALAFEKFPKLKAFIYYDAKAPAVPTPAALGRGGKNYASVKSAFEKYLKSEDFKLNDAGAPDSQSP